jgi:uncharacterized protein YbjT (DUF2867 family)
MKVFVAGATGQTGRWVVEELVRRNVAVRALVRDLEKAKQTLPETAELVVGDVLQLDSLRTAIADSTAIISATGAAPSFDPTVPYKVDFEGTKNLVDVGKEKGINQFVMVSSLCVSQFFHPLNLFWLILVWKKKAEEYLRQSGLTYTVVRPGGLKNEDNTDGIVMSQPDTLFEGSIPRQKVAQVCVEALFSPEAKNKVVEIVAKEAVANQPLAELFANIA